MSKVVKSLRVEPELWTRVEGFAEKHGLKVNGAAERLLELGLLHMTLPVVKVNPRSTADLAAHGSVVEVPAPARWSLAKAGVPFGRPPYVASAPKGAKK